MIEVEATVVSSDQAPAGVELVDATIRVIAEAVSAPPFELRRPELNAQLPTLLDHAAVSLRHPARRAVASIAAASVSGFRSTLDGLGFTEVFTPKVVAAATESGANVFPIDWFGRRAYLAQSPQFYKQIMVGVFERVYEVGPVFRAEPHDTVRHLAQYLSLDAEIGFITDHRDVMNVLRDRAGGDGRHHSRARTSGLGPAHTFASGGPRRDPGCRVPPGAGDDRARHRSPNPR